MTKKKQSKEKFKIILVISILIGVLGFFVYTNSQLRLPSQPKTVTNTSPSPGADLQEWKTFTHQLGYSFQYPPNLKAILLENSEIIVLRSTENVDMGEDRLFDSTISVLKNEDKRPLDEFIKQEEGVVNGRIPSTAEYTGTPFFREILSFEKKTVGGNSAYFFRADPCSICRGQTYRTYIKLSLTRILNFDIFVDKQRSNPESYKVYDQILSTFQLKN